jgi:hypothetical protein
VAAVLAIVAVLAVTGVASGAGATLTAGPAGPAPSHLAEEAVSGRLSLSDVTETWSTGSLPDAGQPIALSSPIPADLDGRPDVVVGDRRGLVYAYHLDDGTPVAGWPTTDESGPIDSTPSIAPLAGGASEVLVGSGNDADPTSGGYQAYGPTGARLWFTPVVNPPQHAPATSMQAGMTVGRLQTGVDTFAGTLGQVAYALDAGTGGVLGGWPFYDSDSTHSTAALADLYGTGQHEIVVGGDQSTGSARNQQYYAGGHLRVLSSQGNLICRADTDQVVDSSPAVGGFLSGGATGIVVGTGTFFPGASDTDTLKAYDTRCRQQWSVTLNGGTYSSRLCRRSWATGPSRSWRVPIRARAMVAPSTHSTPPPARPSGRPASRTRSSDRWSPPTSPGPATTTSSPRPWMAPGSWTAGPAPR